MEIIQQGLMEGIFIGQGQVNEICECLFCSRHFGLAAISKVPRTQTVVIVGSIFSHLMTMTAGTPLPISRGTTTFNLAATVPMSSGQPQSTPPVETILPAANAFLVLLKALTAPAIMLGLVLVLCIFLCFIKSRLLVATCWAVSGAVYLYILQDIDLDGLSGILVG